MMRGPFGRRRLETTALRLLETRLLETRLLATRLLATRLLVTGLLLTGLTRAELPRGDDAPEAQGSGRPVGTISSLARSGAYLLAASPAGVFASRAPAAHADSWTRLDVCVGVDRSRVTGSGDPESDDPGSDREDAAEEDAGGRPIAIASFRLDGAARLLVAGGRPARSGRLWLHALSGDTPTDGTPGDSLAAPDGTAPDRTAPDDTTRDITRRAITARCIATRRVARDLLYALALSPDGSRALVGGDDGRVELVDTRTLSPLADLPSHARPVRDLAFSADGRRAASAGVDGLIILTRVDGMLRRADVELDGKESRTESATPRLSPEHILTEHTAAVECLAFTPSGERLASGARDGRVRIHDVSTGRFLRAFRVLPDEVWALAYSPGGERLLAGLADGTLIELSLDPREEEIQRLSLDRPIRSILVERDGEGFPRVWSASSAGPHRLESRLRWVDPPGDDTRTGREDRP